MSGPGEPDADGASGRTDEQRNGFLAIGMVFAVLGLTGFAGDGTARFAFLPVGIVFLVLGLQWRRRGSGGEGDGGAARTWAARSPRSGRCSSAWGSPG